MPQFKVRDFRNKGFFLIDDAYLNGYAKIFGSTASMIYFSLCRHADKEQKAFPPQKLIGEELNINERTVRRKISVLCKANVIQIKKIRTKDGKWLNNTYLLLDKTEWKTKEELSRGHQSPVVKPEDILDITRGHGSPIKDTHTKGTHILSKDNSKLTVYGNPDINELVSYLQEKMEIPRLDGSQKTNRQYANTLLKRSKKGVEGVKWLINVASQDGWFKNHITSFRDLWNNQIKIIASVRQISVKKKGGFVDASL